MTHLAHEEIVNLLTAAHTGDLELVAYVDELLDAHRADAVVTADLERGPRRGWRRWPSRDQPRLRPARAQGVALAAR